MPIAQFHPAHIAAARLTILGEALFGPPAAPVFQMDVGGVRGGVGKQDAHAVDLAGIFPEETGTIAQRQRRGRGIEGRTWQGEIPCEEQERGE